MRVLRLQGLEDEALALAEEGSASGTLIGDGLIEARPAPLRADYLFTSEESACSKP